MATAFLPPFVPPSGTSCNSPRGRATLPACQPILSAPFVLQQNSSKGRRDQGTSEPPPCPAPQQLGEHRRDAETPPSQHPEPPPSRSCGLWLCKKGGQHRPTGTMPQRGRKAKKLLSKGVVLAGPGFLPAADPACSRTKRVSAHRAAGEAARRQRGHLPAAQAGTKQAPRLRETQALCKNTSKPKRPESHQHTKSPALPRSGQWHGSTAASAGPGRRCECGNGPRSPAPCHSVPALGLILPLHSGLIPA